MKVILPLVCFLLIILGCNKEEAQSSSNLSTTSSAVSSSQDPNDFSDLEKKDDESCDTTEDLEKKIKEKSKKQEAFKLQGGDEGCSTDH